MISNEINFGAERAAVSASRSGSSSVQIGSGSVAKAHVLA